MSTKPYLKGPSGVLRADSKWLGVADLPWDRDTKVTIEHAIQVVSEKMSGNEPVNGIGLKFVGKKKQWKFGAECLSMLNRLFTNEVSNWIGKEIFLYVDPSVMSFGVNTGGIRIRDKAADAMRQRANEIAGGPPDPEPSGASAEPSTPFALDGTAPEICGGTWGETADSPAEPCELDDGHAGGCGPKEG